MRHIGFKIPARGGFTLIEVLVAMGVFIVILVIASQAFNTIITQSSKFSKMEETNIEGVIGLEVMRHDLEQIGYGLPWGFSTRSPALTGDLVDSTAIYSESADTVGAYLNDGTGSASSGVPRAFVGLGKGSSLLPTTTFGDFIAFKGASIGRDKGAQRWTYVPYHNISTSSGRSSQPVSLPSSNTPRAGSDKVIAINSNFNEANKNRRLLIEPGSSDFFFVTFSMSNITENYLPATDQDTVLLYGIDGSTTPRMPFNRADYFISTASGTVPSFCAPGTGVLYKATVNHGTGSGAGEYTYLPILDCVADMRVVLGWDSDGSGAVKTYSTLPTAVNGDPGAIWYDGSAGASASDIGAYLQSAEEIRKRLKTVKVYILAQDGKVDRNYTGSATMVVGDTTTSNNTYNFSAAQKNYRWKLYRIVARPKNLTSNQN